MKELNIQIVKEGIDFNKENLDYYKKNTDLENLKIELVKKDLNIKGLERLINIFTKDLQVKEGQIDKLKKEIEDLKKGKK